MPFYLEKTHTCIFFTSLSSNGPSFDVTENWQLILFSVRSDKSWGSYRPPNFQPSSWLIFFISPAHCCQLFFKPPVCGLHMEYVIIMSDLWPGLRAFPFTQTQTRLWCDIDTTSGGGSEVDWNCPNSPPSYLIRLHNFYTEGEAGKRCSELLLEKVFELLLPQQTIWRRHFELWEVIIDISHCILLRYGLKAQKRIEKID